MKKLSSKIETIETSVLESAKSGALSELTFELGEVAIDTLLDDGLAREIPFFGMVVKAHDALNSFQEKLFAGKVYKFLKTISEVSQEDRERLIDQISKKKGGTIAAGTAILELIDKLDAEKKPKFVGELFNACARGHISLDEYLRLSDAIAKIYVSDLELLADPHPSGLATPAQKSSLVSLGLMTMRVRNPSKSAGSSIGMLQLAEDIYKKPLEFDYALTLGAAQISLHCFGLNRFSDEGIEGFS
ncbi:MAG: hypothetical protein K0M70_08285 [Arenimonas sp.]|uniref:hypothetical protein n=1 Tax=Arenimonas sp. TaxID=1872635 RepID=UPI0025BB21ED|nr:hypothetical protein [Arenimonas sp.]MBW8367840.1 hypothetical protein [Arenimonas sp.]